MRYLISLDESFEDKLGLFFQSMEKLIEGLEIPGIAGHLISASLLSAPAAVVMAKVLYPEREKPQTLGLRVRLGRDLYALDGKSPASFLDAAVQGAMEGVKLIIGICAILIAFLGILSLTNAMIGGAAGKIGLGDLSC